MYDKCFVNEIVSDFDLAIKLDGFEWIVNVSVSYFSFFNGYYIM